MRVAAPQQLVLMRPDLWEPVPELGWRKRPNVVTTINTGEGRVTVRTDSDGFRVGATPHAAVAHPDAARRVLLLGDSFMEALQVEHEASLAGVLERELGERLAAPVEVRNSGVSAWDPPQYLLQARQALAAGRYDAVAVSVYLGNDMVTHWPQRFSPRTPAERSEWRLPRAPSREQIVSGVLRPLNDALERRSHAFVLVKNQARTLRMRLGLTADYLPTELLRTEKASARWAVTAAICAAIAREAAAHDTPIFFLLVPSSYQVDRAALAAYVRGFGLDSGALDADLPNRAFTQALAAQGLSALDATPALRAAHARGVRAYGRVDPHFSAAGHAEVGQLVAPALVSLLEQRGGTTPTPAP